MIPRGAIGLLCYFSCYLLVAQSNIETVVQKGHSGAINVLKFSRDGRFMVTGSDDQTIKLWDVNTGREIRTFKGHQEGIKDVDINVEEGFIVSSGNHLRGTEIKVWDIFTGNAKKTLKGGEALNIFNIDALEWAYDIRTLAVAPDGKTLIWGEDNLGIQIGKITKTRSDDHIPTDWEPNTIVFNPDGKSFAAGGDHTNSRIDGRSNEVRIYSFPELSLIKVLELPNHNINQVIYSQDGQHLACLNTQITWEGSAVNDTGTPLTRKKYNNKITVYELRSDQVVFETEKNGWEISRFAFSPNAKFIAIPFSPFDTLSFVKTNVLQPEKIHLHSLEQPEWMDSINTQEYRIYSLGFTPDNQVLITNGKNITYWSTSDWRKVKEIIPPSKIDDFLISESSIVTSRLINNQRILFSISPENINFSSREVEDFSHSELSRDGKTMYRSQGNKIIAYDPSGLIEPRTILEYASWDEIIKFDISHSGRFIACMGNDKKEILFMDTENSAEPTLLEGHRKSISSLKFSPDEKLLASGSEGNKIFLWDLETGNQVHQFLGHNSDILALVFSKDGTKMASGSEDRNIKLWDVRKKQRIHTFLGHESDILTMDFNDDGSLLVSGSGDKLFGGKSELIIWDTKKKRKVRSIEGNDGYINKVQFIGNRIYSIGYDPILKVYNSEDGEIIYSYIPLGLNDYIIYTNDNYYTSTKMKTPPVHFVDGLDIYSFENFDLNFNRPDVILERLGSKDEKLKAAFSSMYKRRLKKLGFDESMLSANFHLPTTEILDKDNIPLVSSSNEISFAIEVKDEESKIERLFITVNNIPIYGSRGLGVGNENMPFGKKGAYINKQINLKLNKGVNNVKISGLNSGGAESHKDGFEIIYNQPGEKPDLYLLGIGISKYQDSGMNLQYAVKDASDIVEFLSAANPMYNKIIVDTLFNESVTQKNFEELKDRLYGSNVDDHVILFMAGHGLLDEDFNFNFASYSVNPDNPQSGGISYDQIEAIMDSIPARKKLVLIDACHSGEIDKLEIEELAMQEVNRLGMTGEIRSQTFKKLKMNVFKFYGVNNSSVEMMGELFTNLSRGSGAVVISAAAGNSYALESSDWNNGIFTSSILNGLSDKSADLNQDKSISVMELKTYVVERVFNLTMGRQKPTSREENLEFDFTVWK